MANRSTPAGGRRRSIAALVGRIVAAGAAGYLGVAAFEGSRRIVRPGRRPLELDGGGPVTPGDIGLPYSDVRFTTDDGYTLAGWLVPAERETTAAVILLHGFSWHRLPWLPDYVPWLRPRYNILLFDFRGHGESDEAPITLGTAERRDVAAAVRFMENRGFGPIALMGISMGGAVAVAAAPDLPVAAVIADAAFGRLENPIANRMREMGYPLARLGARLIVAAASLRTRTWLRDPIQRVAQIAPRGLLLVAPEEDQLVSWTESRALYERAAEPKELYVVPGAAHSDAHAVAGAEYERRVLSFLARHLDGEPAATGVRAAAPSAQSTETPV